MYRTYKAHASSLFCAADSALRDLDHTTNYSGVCSWNAVSMATAWKLNSISNRFKFQFLLCIEYSSCSLKESRLLLCREIMIFFFCRNSAKCLLNACRKDAEFLNIASSCSSRTVTTGLRTIILPRERNRIFFLYTHPFKGIRIFFCLFLSCFPSLCFSYSLLICFLFRPILYLFYVYLILWFCFFLNFFLPYLSSKQKRPLI